MHDPILEHSPTVCHESGSGLGYLFLDIAFGENKTHAHSEGASARVFHFERHDLRRSSETQKKITTTSTISRTAVSDDVSPIALSLGVVFLFFLIFFWMYFLFLVFRLRGQRTRSHRGVR